MTTQQNKVHVFLYYSPKDKEWADQLLMPLRQNRIISIWHNEMINAGYERSKTTDQYLK